MIEDLFFLDEGSVEITAASVGISRLRWTNVNESEIPANQYQDIMKSNRFDLLPIVPPSGIITEFFKTKVPNNYENIERCCIKYDDIIPISTNIKYVIEKFANEERTFFFLSYHKNISGLITLGNLNCKQVQIFIFSLVCELERELGDFLNLCLTNQQIIDWTTGKVNKTNPNKYDQMLKNYHKLEKIDLENQFTEHFFLIDFFNIINERKLFGEIGFSGSEWRKLNSINELRKRIAHPTRSILDKENGIKKLKERISKIEDLTFRLITKKKTAAANK